MGNSVCCLVILVIFIGLGRAYGLGEILKSSCEGEGGGVQSKWNGINFMGEGGPS